MMKTCKACVFEKYFGFKPSERDCELCKEAQKQ